ncbi:MAG: ABC transporter permease [Kineosporiaceae bacterium]
MSAGSARGPAAAPGPAPPATGREPRRRARLADNGIIAVFVVLVAALAVSNPTFRTLDNVVNIGQQSAILAIAAFAMTLVIIAGSIDLSIGAVASAVGVITAMRLAAGDSVPTAMAVGLAAAVAFGLVNATAVVVGRVPSFIATLATFYVAQGISLSLTGGQTIAFDADGFRAAFATGAPLGLPSPLWWALAAFAATFVLLHRSRFGLHVFAVGGDRASSAMLGLPVARVRFAVLAISGALMGIVGMILVARIGNARSDGAIGLEFDAIAAVVIGGTAFSGGRGSLVRTVVGVLFIGVLNNGLALLDVDFNTQQIVKGVLVVAAVLVDRWARGGRG